MEIQSYEHKIKLIAAIAPCRPKAGSSKSHSSCSLHFEFLVSVDRNAADVTCPWRWTLDIAPRHASSKRCNQASAQIGSTRNNQTSNRQQRQRQRQRQERIQCQQRVQRPDTAAVAETGTSTAAEATINLSRYAVTAAAGYSSSGYSSSDSDGYSSSNNN